MYVNRFTITITHFTVVGIEKFYITSYITKRIGGVMISVLASSRWSAVDCVLESRSGEAKYYKICICCLFAKYVALRSKSIYWLARNVSEWSDMSTCGLLFQWAITIKKNPTKSDTINSSTLTCSCQDIAAKLLIWC